MHTGSKDSSNIVKYAALTFACAALCLCAGWAATTAASGSDRAEANTGSRAAIVGKGAAYVEGAAHDHRAAAANYNGLERYSTWENTNGKAATYQPEGPFTADNPFFRPLGTNGRACALPLRRHQPPDRESDSRIERFQFHGGESGATR